MDPINIPPINVSINIPAPWIRHGYASCPMHLLAVPDFPRPRNAFKDSARSAAQDAGGFMPIGAMGTVGTGGSFGTSAAKCGTWSGTRKLAASMLWAT